MAHGIRAKPVWGISVLNKARKEQVGDLFSQRNSPSTDGNDLTRGRDLGVIRSSVRRSQALVGRLGGVLLLLLFLAPALCAEQHWRVMEPVRQLTRENRFEEAIALLEVGASRAKHPDDQGYYLKEASAIALGQLKDEARAMRLAEAIAEPMRSQSQQLVVLAGAQRWQDIINRFGDVDIDAWPEIWRLDALAARSQAWLKSGNTARAEQDLKSTSDALGSVVTRGRACQLLGALYQNTLHDPERALTAYRKGLSLTEATYAWHNECFLGMIGILKGQGRYDEAAAAFKTADYRKPSNDHWLALFYLAHADVLRHQGSTGQAATMLTSALRLGNLSDSTRQQIQSELDQLMAGMWENQ